MEFELLTIRSSNASQSDKIPKLEFLILKDLYRKTSNNAPPLIIPAPQKFQKKVSRTSNNVRPLIIPAPIFLLVCRLAHTT